MLRREKGMASFTTTCLNLKPPYPAKIAPELHTMGYLVSKFQNVDGRRGNKSEHDVRFLDPMGLLTKDVNLCF